jgi:hypothetical protein
MLFNERSNEILLFALTFLQAKKQLEEKLFEIGEHQTFEVSQAWLARTKNNPLQCQLPAKSCPSSWEINKLIKDICEIN